MSVLICEYFFVNLSMLIQHIHDNRGNTTGVFIPIEDWQELTVKYSGLQKSETESPNQLSNWQKKIIDNRLNDYYSNPKDVSDFGKMLDDLESEI
jgi:hypothetical protein